jgi:hypothetical protein
VSDLVKIEISRPNIEFESALVNMLAETNKEMTEKLRECGVYPFWYSWHQDKGAVRFVAYGVPDATEAANLQWDNRAARIRIGLKP